MFTKFISKNLRGLKGGIVFDYLVISGATGWIGQVLVTEALRAGFLPEQLLLLGSKSGELGGIGGQRLPVFPLEAGWSGGKLRGSRVLVFHLAFLTKEKVGMTSDASYLERNRSLSAELVRGLEGSLVEGVVLASSGAVYDSLQQRGDARQAGVGLYGEAKLRDEEFFRQQFGSSRLLIPRIFNIAGAYINKPENYALSSFITSALADQPIRIRSPKLVYRSYVSVSDLMLCLLRTVWKNRGPLPSQPFDTTVFPEIESLDLAHMVSRIVGRDSPVLVDAGERQGIDRYLGDGETMAHLFKAAEIVPRPLEVQIRDTVDYLRTTNRV